MQERAEITRAKLLDAAQTAFSERGFEAVTMRDIEEQAGVQRNLALYNFSDKSALWKAVVNRLVELLRPALPNEDQPLEGDTGKSDERRARLAAIIRAHVHFSAANTAFHRFMMQEGKQDSWRIQYLIDAFLRPVMMRLRPVVEHELDLSDGEFFHWYYLFFGAGPMPFTMAPEARALFGVSTGEEHVIEQHAEIMVDFLLSRTSSTKG